MAAVAALAARRRVQDDHGSAAVIFALILPVLLGFSSLVVDVGHASVARRQMQNAADAAALAASSLLPTSNANVLQQATTLAINIAADNGALIGPADVEFATESTANDQVTVHAGADVSFFFARFLNVTSGAVSARASARVGSVVGAVGVQPWGVAIPSGGFVFGDSYCLKLGSNGGGGICGGARQGNFEALDIDDNNGSGSGSIYRDLITTGSRTQVMVGQTKKINTGAMVGPTQQGTGCTGNSGLITGNNQELSDVITTAGGSYRVIDWTSPRLVTIPVVHYPDTATAVIDGFAVFFLSTCGSNGAVLGKFIDTMVPDGLWGTYHAGYGSRISKLVG